MILYWTSTHWSFNTIDVMSPSQVGELIEDANSNDVIWEKMLNSLHEIDSLCKTSLDVDNEDEMKRKLQAFQACIATRHWQKEEQTLFVAKIVTMKCLWIKFKFWILHWLSYYLYSYILILHVWCISFILIGSILRFPCETLSFYIFILRMQSNMLHVECINNTISTKLK